ncbi:hypothetical protein DID88_004009 [Monilinia fructigena]|uniref:Uncharacterized protein n=1 Tax=Monilinia fructigena TaxID=38457 RepID=A0A395IDQ3_9HELO|nr:hypothetical protein DID88_004009 [Monilinia fructigena]
MASTTAPRENFEVRQTSSTEDWQADHVAKHMSSDEVNAFEKVSAAGKEHVRKYGDGKAEAPVKDLQSTAR